MIGAIDVGTNAARLKLVEPLSPGHYEVLYHHRAPIRPGEGVYATGVMPPATVDRLIDTLHSYHDICQRYRATVRAVATSALREASNQEEILKRIRQEVGLELHVISGMEEARLICLGVLHGTEPGVTSLVIDIGGGSTEVVTAQGTKPVDLQSVGLGCVQLSEKFDTGRQIKKHQLGLMREYVRQTLRKAFPGPLASIPRNILGSSGTIRSLTNFATDDDGKGFRPVTRPQVSQAVEKLARMDFNERARLLDTRRAEVIVAGGVILECIMDLLALPHVTPTAKGLRDGLILDIHRRLFRQEDDRFLEETALRILARFGLPESHARQVERLALTLFDALATTMSIPEEWRSFLEVAALLDDLGYAVNRQRHHHHSRYLVQHMDSPGLSLRERQIIGEIVRVDSKSLRKKEFDQLDRTTPLTKEESRALRGVALFLRLADALDRSHRQLVTALQVRRDGTRVVLEVNSKEPIDLELWSARKLLPIFEEEWNVRLHLPEDQNNAMADEA